MIIQKTTLNQLKDFGLNSYESKLWTALLSRGTSTAGELSDITNVPRSRAYDVLESLEKKGFVMMRIGKPIKYLAVDPEHVLERVRSRIKEEAEAQSQIISKIAGSELLNELKLLHQNGVKKITPEDLSGVFKGRKNTYHQIERKIKASSRQVIIQTTASGLLRDAGLLKTAIRKAKENGAKVMITAPITKENEAAAREMGKYAEIRDCSTEGRLYIFDREETVFMPSNDKDVHHTYDSAIWVKSEFFTSAMKKLFMTTWASLKKNNRTRDR